MLAGKEYGTGSSRDWAAKGPKLLGVRAVIAESYERIHRSNLLMMGILPLVYRDGESRESLGLTGEEEFAIEGLEGGDAREVTVAAGRQDVHGDPSARHAEGARLREARRHPPVRRTTASWTTVSRRGLGAGEAQDKGKALAADARLAVREAYDRVRFRCGCRPGRRPR